MDNENKQVEDFKQTKIKNLNKFFMKSVRRDSLVVIFLFILTIAILSVIPFWPGISTEFKITMISLCVTYTTSTSKSLIDKYLSLIEYKTELLVEEQRGLSKNAGIEIEKVSLDSIQEDENKNSKKT